MNKSKTIIQLNTVIPKIGFLILLRVSLVQLFKYRRVPNPIDQATISIKDKIMINFALGNVSFNTATIKPFKPKYKSEISAKP